MERWHLLVLVVLPLITGISVVSATTSNHHVTGQNIAINDFNGPKDPNARAIPPTPGSSATHDVRTGTSSISNGTGVKKLVLQYESSDNVSLTNVSASEVEPYIFRNIGSADYRREFLTPTTVTIDNHTITVRIEDPVQVNFSDAIGIRVKGVQNPPTRGKANVTLSVNPEESSRATTRAAIDIHLRQPELSNQGRVGTNTRIAVTWPEDVAGFLVARTSDEEIVGTTFYDPATEIHADIPLPRLVDSEVDGPVTITVTAYRDVDRNGNFEPEVDKPVQKDGNPLLITIRGALDPPAKTTESVTTTTSLETTTMSRTHGNGTDSVEDSRQLPGFGFAITATAIVVLLVALILRRDI